MGILHIRSIRRHILLDSSSQIHTQSQKLRHIEIQLGLKQMALQIILLPGTFLIIIIVREVIPDTVASSPDTHGDIRCHTVPVHQITPVRRLRQIEIPP